MINGSGQMVCDGPFCDKTTALTFDHPIGWLTTRYDYNNWADFCGVTCVNDFNSHHLIELLAEDYDILVHHNVD